MLWLYLKCFSLALFIVSQLKFLIFQSCPVNIWTFYAWLLMHFPSAVINRTVYIILLDDVLPLIWFDFIWLLLHCNSLCMYNAHRTSIIITPSIPIFENHLSASLAFLCFYFSISLRKHHCSHVFSSWLCTCCTHNSQVLVGSLKC